MTPGWSTVEIAGKSVLIHEPLSVPRTGVVCLMDAAGGLLKHLPFRAAVESSPRLWIFPFEQETWWCDLPHAAFPAGDSPETWLRRAVPAWLVSQLGQGARTAWLGFDFGGQTVLKLTFDAPRQFPVVAAFLPDIDFHENYGQGTSLDAIYSSAEAARQRSAILRIHPPGPEAAWILTDESCETHPATERLVEKLCATGVEHTYSPFDQETWMAIWDGPLWENVSQFLAMHLDRPPRLPMA